MHAEARESIFVGLPARVALSRGPLRLWLTEPLGMVTQLDAGAHASLGLARLIAGPATEALFRLREQAGGRRLRFVHDWRGLTSYESGARQVLTEWALRLGATGIERVDILLGPSPPSFVRMGTTVGQAALAVAGVTTRVHYEPAAFARSCDAPSLRPHPGWRAGTCSIAPPPERG